MKEQRPNLQWGALIYLAYFILGAFAVVGFGLILAHGRFDSSAAWWFSTIAGLWLLTGWSAALRMLTDAEVQRTLDEVASAVNGRTAELLTEVAARNRAEGYREGHAVGIQEGRRLGAAEAAGVLKPAVTNGGDVVP